MADNKHTERKIPNGLKNQIYLDPRYDTAFKLLFASETALKDFLDAALGLEGNDKIENITYTVDETINFQTPRTKKIILDIFATTKNKRFFDIEMQKEEHDFFIDRAIIYNAFLVIKGKQQLDASKEFRNLPKKERESRRYEIPECVSIWITDFDLPGTTEAMSPKDSTSPENAEPSERPYMDEWQLYSKGSVEARDPLPIFPKNRYIFISLRNFKKSQENIRGSLDAWLYLMTHASDGTELPTFGNDAIADALTRIRIENVADEQLAKQEKEMVTKEEIQTRLASAWLKGEREGREKGREEGREEGRAEGREEARAEFDAEKTRYEAEIAALKAQLAKQ